jgi:hypothetical protein
MIVTSRVHSLMGQLDAWRADIEDRLAEFASAAATYWTPRVTGEEFGFTDGQRFVALGRLA